MQPSRTQQTDHACRSHRSRSHVALSGGLTLLMIVTLVLSASPAFGHASALRPDASSHRVLFGVDEPSLRQTGARPVRPAKHQPAPAQTAARKRQILNALAPIESSADTHLVIAAHRVRCAHLSLPPPLAA